MYTTPVIDSHATFGVRFKIGSFQFGINSFSFCVGVARRRHCLFHFGNTELRAPEGVLKMSDNRISANLSQRDREEVMQAITTIREKLPFLIDLTAEERRSLPKLGDKSRAFVSKALEVATQNQDFLPRSFDLDEMRRDVELFDALYPVLLSLTQLQELVDDTFIASGSEAYTAALAVYNYAKASGNVAGLDAVIDDMGRRFSRKARKVQPPNTIVSYKNNSVIQP